MNGSRYEKIGEVNGRWKADIIESLLTSQDIQVQLFQDSITHHAYKGVYDLVAVFVPGEQAALSRELLGSFEEFRPSDDEH
jgi:hypothetical protein